MKRRGSCNAQHHSYKVLETRRVPGPFQPPAMTDVKDFALSKSDLDVINPGPGEYVHVMEGQRHGYENLTIGITYTAPGGAPPMHTHKGEESHVLLKGQKVLYALGDKIFVKEGPYIVNIPPGVPALVPEPGRRGRRARRDLPDQRVGVRRSGLLPVLDSRRPRRWRRKRDERAPSRGQ